MLPSPLPAAQFLGRSITKTQLCVLQLVEMAASQPFAAFVVIIIIVVWLLEERVSEGKMTHSKVMVWSSDRHSIQLLSHSLAPSPGCFYELDILQSGLRKSVTAISG